MKLAVVTGASSGIGAATAREFAAQGFRVVLVGRSAERLATIAADLEERAVVEPCDASRGDDVLALAQRVRASLGVPEVIVNAAGAGAWKRIEETPPDEAVSMIAAPYLAAFNVTHAFMDGMLARGSGVIVHVGSPAAYAAWPSSVGYTAARAALRGMHEALVADLHGTGVRSCHVVFGRVDTAYFDTNAHTAERAPTLGKLIPTLSAEQCARVILRVAKRPRNRVFHPMGVRLMYGLHRVVPGLAPWLLRVTGHSVRTADKG